MINVEGVVLAAGFSRRAEAFKMELPLGDKTLIERTIEGMHNVCDRIIVVGGFRIGRLREILRNYPNVEVVYNENYTLGMFSSVKEGVKHVKACRFFLLPGDCPLIGEKIYRKMLEVDADIVVPVYKGRKGHPVLMKSVLLKELLKEPVDSTLKNFIKKKGFETVEVCEESIIIDVDSIEDYERVRKRFEENK